jgi:hypothetical protein
MPTLCGGSGRTRSTIEKTYGLKFTKGHDDGTYVEAILPGQFEVEEAQRSGIGRLKKHMTGWGWWRVERARHSSEK